MEYAQKIEREVEFLVAPARLHVGNARKVLREACVRPGGTVVINLADTVSVDSSALGEIVALHRRLVESGGRVVLAGPRAGVQRVLSITKLEQIIAVFADTCAAASATRG